ncbi:uncharacterized protein L969DRAFT_91224 [Mixia osmundae IAM 14324]|uniref:Serine/threonine-protein kinase TOR n=1 Tax=Mixia osmundae (strain CBS 9802 / IAM 14324 / JCM 22182 / KY 12970) TaxID=764103 RepID=G7DS05_MIXOS|nr:uncharacterized protein L969DRAFT_91224 [Mixia osmundae IAM 14324]KEI36150.1 hypothetical protein L969DRAFT_91224 [Mixia osmundae IAM 14324]GAA93365.1 hypothetical protein E5Q_00005 [Mixia osmundae IAM 14324]
MSSSAAGSSTGAASMQQMLQCMRSRGDDRLRATSEFRQYILAGSQGSNGFARIWSEISPHLFTLCNSTDVNDKLAGISAIDSIIDILPAGDPLRASRLVNFTSKALPCADPQVMSLAAKAYARLVSQGGNAMNEYVDVQIKAALEWLQGERIENRRYAAALVVRELAKAVPALVYEHVPELLDNLWTALRDPKVAIRESAAAALNGCLEIASQREGQLKNEWYIMVFEQAQRGFKMATPDAIHGSLLGYQELFLRAGMFMHARYIEVCEQIFSYKDHRETLVRKAVIELIPTLASYNHTEFIAHYLHKGMVYLLGQLKKERDRAISYHAIGHVALSVTSSMAPYLDAVLASIKDGLLARGRKTAPPESAIFQCISMLATAVGQALTKHMHELLDLMFAFGLSESLCRALVDLAHHIPPLAATVRTRLLNLLSMILSGQPFRPPGAPPQAKLNGSLTLREPELAAGAEQRNPSIISLALVTLGTFDFTGHVLSEFVKDTVVGYLEDDSADVRKASAQTCCKLFARDPVIFQTSSHAIRLVGTILEKLLIVAIADPDPTIRQTTLESLDPKFDRHLAQAENVRSLFIALNDEIYGNRVIAIKIIGRLSAYNPAYVMPSLRKTLIQLLTELEYSTSNRSREESATLLTLLISASQRLTKPYVLPIIKVLLPKARDRVPAVASSIMLALGELAKVGGEDVLPHLEDYMTLIIETLYDQASPIKRDAALHALGQLASHSGYVIDPYLDHPSLLGNLIAVLKSEQNSSIRRETIRVMGILGALDPYRQTAGERQSSETAVKAQNPADPSHPANIGPSHDEYYPTIAFSALLAILRDPSLSNHHTAVIEAVMYIFRSLRLKCVTFLPQVIPAFLGAMRSCSPGLQEYYFQNLGHLIAMVRQHVRNHLDPILGLIKDFWPNGAGVQLIIVDLIESIAVALEGEFKVYLPALLPALLSVFDGDGDRKTAIQLRVLHAFGTIGANLEEYLHLVIPVIVRTMERTTAPINIRKAAIQTAGILCRKINFADYASRIIHPLARILTSAPTELKIAAMDALCALVAQIGADYASFIPMVNKCLVQSRIQHQKYQHLISTLLKGESLPEDLGYGNFDVVASAEANPAADAGINKLPVNQQNLKSAWETVDRAKPDDWREWLKRLSVQLLKSSPSHSLRACANLAEVYQPLARDLFNASFVSCWTELYDQYQDELVRAIESALSSPTVPPEIMQTLLNLAEFMEHDDKVLPISIRALGSYATKCHAYAKALHYKELECMTEPMPETIEALIRINNQLQQPDVAVGILTHAQRQYDIALKEDWYEKLERWEDALAAYERKQQDEPDNIEIVLGRMRCLHALGEWESLSHLAQENWSSATLDVRRKIAPLAAAAAWGLTQWETMDDYISALKHDSADRSWFRAILNIHRNQFNKAQQHVNKTRDLLDTELTTLIGESYNRAYNQIVRVQMLAELEEIIQYKESCRDANDSRERRQVIQKTWMKRLRGCQPDVEVWQRILKVRALVMTPRENMEMWIKFANLCRKSGRLGLAEKTLNSLLGDDYGDAEGPAMQGPPHVIYAHLKFMWASGAREETLAYLRDFTARLSQDLGLQGSGDRRAQTELLMSDSLQDYTHLLARCYYKLGEWQMTLQDDWGSEHVPDVLKSYLVATRLDHRWYKAWHAWALANSEVVSHYVKTQPDNEAISPELFAGHLVPSVQAFFQSIALSPGNSVQDTLRLLTLWFKYGYHPDVSGAIAEGFTNVSVDTWLEVIPQLIARIHAPSANVRRLIQQVLTDVGRAHPQALVYALTVASKYPSAPRRKAALAIMDKMREHSALLVEQALLVSQELIRVAILWQELWHEGLEEASRLFYGDHNVEAMFATLDPLHDMLERGPETLREIAFHQTYGRDLQDARESCRRYKQYGEHNDLNRAWDLYYHVFRKITKALPQTTVLELQHVSPKLLAVKDLSLAVPGTYHSGKPIVRIGKFAPAFDVLTSKQRPRKLRITGSDGHEYPFLLKGHEDLRQDERVMQLFGLVNTLLSRDPETFKRHLSIQRYPVVPLSPNSGLLGWVEQTDTLHVLIKNYRDSRKILLNIEHRLMLQMAPDYDHLCLMQKIEVFEYALDNTTGQDLYRVLWLKSRNSEAWLDRRSNYSRSLACMSMIGHILGLGDRHPSNLLLERGSARVVHVDFGDCFEVAMAREKYPERVPFRLTRMLTLAMEISGVEGTFRLCCENTMRVARDNKESIIAVLEAFVHDPLINWRLVTGSRKTPAAASEVAQEGGRAYARRPKVDETNLADEEAADALNQRALQVVDRVTQKLTGRDFKPTVSLSVADQVDKLIVQATAIENLSQSFVGWCAFW